MARLYEVLAGSLNLREAPGGRILATLPRASRLLESGASVMDAANMKWLAVTPLPHGSPAGYVSDRYVAPVDARGQEGPEATHAAEVTEQRLLTLAPTAKSWIISALAANFSTVVAPYGIVATPRRLCHFLAQAAHESAGFRTLEEYGGETYWSRYEGRADLGNTHAGDGIRYHGRGLFQLTGRANYRTMGTRIGLALEDDPQLVGEGDVSLRTACEFWKTHRLEGPADGNDIVEVTRRVNGGANGLTARKAYFRRAWSIWGDPGQPSGIE